jgi:hypothetical protein
MTTESAICHHSEHDVVDAHTRVRDEQLAHALRLEYLTVGWNVVEGVVAVGAAVVAGSVALLGFGIDSFVESASGSVMIFACGARCPLVARQDRSAGAPSTSARRDLALHTRCLDHLRRWPNALAR